LRAISSIAMAFVAVPDAWERDAALTGRNPAL
jgi:hypothetical protein